ncbi:MAG TPA: aminotransferase class V-fold PLP-dependent enzyme [Planctomycetota bacterium]|nr:aminotransferase class V-fold PLP-dependent enzyme [Planctomycetota bacterium]
MPAFDPGRARRQFPALERTRWALLDNAGGTQILGAAAARVQEAFLESHVQPGGAYPASALATERTEASTRAWARCVNARDPREIVFGASTTQLLQNLSRAIEPGIRPGDEIIVSEADHEANIGPWVRLESRGALLRWWRVRRDDLELAVEDLEALLGPRTRLVAFGHVSNLLGHVHPVREAVRRAHERGAQVVVDGVAFAPHRTLDVQAIGADYYVASLYKIYGPHQALLWGRLDRLEALPGINHFFIPPDRLPHKLAPGGLNFELVHGAGAVPEYLESLGPGGLDEVALHETALAERLLSFLRDRREIRILGRPRGGPDRLPTISFAARGLEAGELARRLLSDEIGIKSGDFYAHRLVEAAGLAPFGGVARASMVHYNTAEEVDRLCRALDRALG